MALFRQGTDLELRKIVVFGVRTFRPRPFLDILRNIIFSLTLREQLINKEFGQEISLVYLYAIRN